MIRISRFSHARAREPKLSGHRDTKPCTEVANPLGMSHTDPITTLTTCIHICFPGNDKTEVYEDRVEQQEFSPNADLICGNIQVTT